MTKLRTRFKHPFVRIFKFFMRVYRKLVMRGVSSIASVQIVQYHVLCGNIGGNEMSESNQESEYEILKNKLRELEKRHGSLGTGPKPSKMPARVVKRKTYKARRRKPYRRRSYGKRRR